MALGTNGAPRITMTNGTTGITLNDYTNPRFLRTTGGTGVLINGGLVNASTEVIGVLPILNGGTNGSTPPAGTTGGVLWYTGTQYAPTPTGVAGEVLTSAGALQPYWSNISSFLPNVQNGLNTSSSPNVELGGPLVRPTTINQAGQPFTIGNGPFYINDNSVAATTFIGTGTTSGNITIGGGNAGQDVFIKSGQNVGNILTINDAALASATKIGTGNTTGNITIGAGGAGPGQVIAIAAGTGSSLNLNDNVTNQTTNIGTGGTIGTINIGGGGGATQAINIGYNPAGTQTITIGSTNLATKIHLPGMLTSAVLLTDGGQNMWSTNTLGIGNGGTNTGTIGSAG